MTCWGCDEGYLQPNRSQTVDRGCIHEWNTVLCHPKHAAQWHSWHVTSILRYLQTLWFKPNWWTMRSMRCHTTANLASASKPLTATGAYSLLIQPRLWVTTCGAKPWAASYLCQCRGEERNIMATLHKANYRCGCLLALLSRQCDAWALWCQRGTSLIGGDICPLRFRERMTKHFL